MAHLEKQVQTTEADGVKTKRTVIDQAEPGTTGVRTEMFVYWIVGIIEGLLAIRILLSLLGANRGNAFAQFIYGVTYPIVAPFYGLFNNEFAYGVARFEVEALIAMIVVALLGWAIMGLIRIFRRG